MLELRDHEAADGANSCGGGAADGSEEHTCEDIDQGEAAGEAADESLGEVHEASGDAALAHEESGEDEEGDGEEGEAAGAGGHALGDDGGGCINGAEGDPGG
ncbi:MAG: hypothetical protein RI897_2345 [Verrucomicrobiota bacterium]